MDKQEQKKLLVEIMEADQKDGLYKQQTAVEWLVDQIKRDQNQKALTASEWAEVIEQAKQMEKEQIIRAYKDGCLDSNTDGSNFYFRSKQYYNETYGNKS